MTDVCGFLSRPVSEVLPKRKLVCGGGNIGNGGKSRLKTIQLVLNNEDKTLWQIALGSLCLVWRVVGLGYDIGCCRG